MGLYDRDRVAEMQSREFPTPEQLQSVVAEQEDGLAEYDPVIEKRLERLQRGVQEGEFVKALLNKPLKNGQVFAVTDEFGKAVLLNVRNTFKDPLMIFLYTLFVLAAVYHGFRGLWSFCICWGITLSQRSQQLLNRLSVGLMVLVGALGLAAVWLTYWVTLKS